MKKNEKATLKGRCEELELKNKALFEELQDQNATIEFLRADLAAKSREIITLTVELRRQGEAMSRHSESVRVGQKVCSEQHAVICNLAGALAVITNKIDAEENKK